MISIAYSYSSPLEDSPIQAKGKSAGKGLVLRTAKHTDVDQPKNPSKSDFKLESLS